MPSRDRLLLHRALSGRSQLVGLLLAMVPSASGCGASAPGDPLDATLQAAVIQCPAVSDQDRQLDEQLSELLAGSSPATIDTSGLTATELGTVAFALEADYDQVKLALDVGMALSSGPLGVVVVGALSSVVTGVDTSTAASERPTLDAELMQRGFERYYACVRGFPATRDEFREAFGDYREAAAEVVDDSAVKLLSRTLYQDRARGIFAAETTGPRGTETEIILQGARSDGALDFLAYAEDGTFAPRVPLPKLSATEQFSAPSACILCHRDINDNRVDTVDPRTR